MCNCCDSDLSRESLSEIVGDRIWHHNNNMETVIIQYYNCPNMITL